MGVKEGVNFVMSGAYAGANIDETAYNSGIVQVFSGKNGLFSSKTVHAIFDSTHVESMNVVNESNNTKVLWVTLEIKTVDVQWKDGKRSLVKVTGPIYEQMLSGMYR